MDKKDEIKIDLDKIEEMNIDDFYKEYEESNRTLTGYAKEEKEKNLKAFRKRQIEEIYDRIWNTKTPKSVFENDDNSDSEISRICRGYAKNYEKMLEGSYGLILYGISSVGKTFYAECILNEIIKNNVIANGDLKILISNYTVSNMIDRMLQYNYPEIRANILCKMDQSHIVLLDDFGAEGKADHIYKQLFDVIDTRCRSAGRRSLIITTNKTEEELFKSNDMNDIRLGERILEMCTPILFEGESKRKKIGEQKCKGLFDIIKSDS